MRRDDRPYDPAEGEDELSAIEAQWTRTWEAKGGPRDHADLITKREEFRIMWPYVQRLPKGGRLLDGGCGLGDWTVWFTRAGYPTVGLDVSKATIAKLKTAFPDIAFSVGDIRATGFPDAFFDGYFSWGTFEHFEEGFDRVVAEAMRVLKPGGLLFVSTPFDNLRHSLHAVLGGRRRLEPQAAPTRFYQWRLTRGELAGILARHGFAVDDVRMIQKRHGLQRFFGSNFGLAETSISCRGLSMVASPFVPRVAMSHMILAIARRPEDRILRAVTHKSGLPS